MKKRMLALALVIVMILSMAGCSSGDTKKLVGTWRCEISAEEAVLEEVPEEFEDAVEYLSFEKLYLPVYLEFNRDSTICAYVDEQEFKEMMDGFMESFIADIGRYLADMIYEETGMKVTQDEIWANIGISEQEIRDMFTAEMEDSMKELLELHSEGKYKAEDGKLFITADLDSEFDPEEYLAYSLESDEFRVIGAVGKDEFVGLFPLVFEKVG